MGLAEIQEACFCCVCYTYVTVLTPFSYAVSNKDHVANTIVDGVRLTMH